MSGAVLSGGEAPARPRIYIAGPMTGKLNLNADVFAQAEEYIRQNGYEPVNPHKVHPGVDDWQIAMRHDIAQLVMCDGVGTLPGWQESRGASLEVFLANQLGIPVKPYHHYQ